MYAKDRSFVGALVAVKVQGNAGPEIDNAVKRDLVNMRTFHMEYVCCSKKGRLPACFSRVFGLEVAPFVMMRDPQLLLHGRCNLCRCCDHGGH